MMRSQWLIVAPRVLRQMELLSLSLFSRELASFLQVLLHNSVGNGLSNFQTLSPCISYVHINESSGGFWTRRRAGGLLYSRALQVGHGRFYWSFFRSGSAEKQNILFSAFIPLDSDLCGCGYLPFKDVPFPSNWRCRHDRQVSSHQHKPHSLTPISVAAGSEAWIFVHWLLVLPHFRVLILRQSWLPGVNIDGHSVSLSALVHLERLRSLESESTAVVPHLHPLGLPYSPYVGYRRQANGGGVLFCVISGWKINI